MPTLPKIAYSRAGTRESTGHRRHYDTAAICRLSVSTEALNDQPLNTARRFSLSVLRARHGESELPSKRQPAGERATTRRTNEVFHDRSDQAQIMGHKLDKRTCRLAGAVGHAPRLTQPGADIIH